MEVVKQTDDYKIMKKRSGRFGVKNKSGKWINADEKVKILLNEGLIKVTEAKAPAEEPAAEEAPAEAEENTEEKAE
ncbi:MAG: hypothetical protein CME62_11615 [Halobacteriovoraceae bacterium]|nr:hypothetical protein [Halobacteriovoraceae bacterium]|tara:strand:- start:1099 stop:1326 length:228 start_codon:yes stop_codon:yes gene_type:complete